MSARGVALPAALLALVVIEALVATAFVIGLHEQRLGRSAVAYRQALAAAEEGAYQRVVAWSPTLDSLSPGDSAAFEGTSLAGPGRYRGTTRRLGGRLFLVRAEGSRDGFGARAEVALLVIRDSTGARPLRERSWLRVF
jgi:hypothetical protein